MLEQEIQRRDGGGIGDPVPVVDEERERLTALLTLVDQQGQYVAVGALAVLGEDLAEFLRERRAGRAQRFDEVREEPDDVVVVAVDGEPADGHALRGQRRAPLRRQGALAEPGGAVDDGETRPSGGAQRLDQTGARDPVARQRRPKPGGGSRRGEFYGPFGRVRRDVADRRLG